LWLPVALGSGAALYFALPAEPPGWSAWAALGVAAVLLAPRRAAGSLLAMLAMGFALAKFREERVAAPMLARPVIAHLVARIDAVEPREDGLRLLLSDPRSGAFAVTPRRLRVALKGDTMLHPGEWVSLTASLQPPPMPVEPGAGDFGRAAFFQSVGAVGFGYGGARPVIAPRPPDWSERMADRVEDLRWRMTRRIAAVLPGSEGAIAAALITGSRGAIADDDEAALRDAGLAHVLAIAGLHMALVGGGIFWLVRALLAAVPRLALAYPIKKWAAGTALAASAFYLVISGAAPSSVRAFVMLAMLLLAILFDRPALSMRALAFAAAILLVLRPEAITEPGFQMSFAAVAGLIAVAEWEQSRGRIARGRVMRYARGIAMTSLVGSLATLPFALFHFGRATHYAVLGNLLAMPLMGFWVMPAAALSVAAMPLGLETGPLHLLGAGIDAMLAVGRFVSGLPGAVSRAPAMPLSALVAIALGGLWLAIWRGGLRWWGLAGMALGALLALLAPRPDMLVGADARTVALRGPDGLLHFAGRPPDRFAAGGVAAARRRCARSRASGTNAGTVVRWAGLCRTRQSDDCACASAGGVDGGLPARGHRDQRSTGPLRRTGHHDRPAKRCAGWWLSDHFVRRTPGTQRARVARRAALGISITADQADQLALHLDAIRTIEPGFIGGIGCFQGDGVAAAPQPLQGRFIVVDQRHHDLAGVGGVGLHDDDGVAVQYARVDHGIAGHFQRVMPAAAYHAAGHRDLRHLVLQRLDWRTCRDAPDHRHIDRTFAFRFSRRAEAARIRRHAAFAPAVAAGQAAQRLAAGGGGPQGFGHVVGKFQHLQRPGALFHAAQETAFFQGSDKAVDAGLRFEVQRFFHFVKRGRNAAFPDPLMDERQQLILFAGQHFYFPSVRNFGLPGGRSLLSASAGSEQSRNIANRSTLVPLTGQRANLAFPWLRAEPHRPPTVLTAGQSIFPRDTT
jgi:competence protein ComEC